MTRSPRSVIFPASKYKGKKRPNIDMATFDGYAHQALPKLDYLVLLQHLNGLSRRVGAIQVGIHLSEYNWHLSMAIRTLRKPKWVKRLSSQNK